MSVEPLLRVVAGRLSDAELAAVVAAVTALAAEPEPLAMSGSPFRAGRPPAWREAALAEQAGGAPVATPRVLDGVRALLRSTGW